MLPLITNTTQNLTEAKEMDFDIFSYKYSRHSAKPKTNF